MSNDCLNKRKLKLALAFLVVFTLVLLLPSADSQVSDGISNESIRAQELINKSETCFREMKERDVPLQRANESLTEAKELYESKLDSEKKGVEADYSLVMEYANETCEVKEMAFIAEDQLRVFMETYHSTKNNTNLTELQDEVNAAVNSYEEERFEETPELIDEAYTEMSNIEAEQTTMNLFYESTKDTIENFFKENWKLILIILGAVIVGYIIFKNTLKQITIRLKLRKLENQKESLNSMIQKLQEDYFKKGEISEREFKTKMENYKEIIRDIERQVPSLKEEIHKLKKKK